jgi:hypothetical protein
MILAVAVGTRPACSGLGRGGVVNVAIDKEEVSMQQRWMGWCWGMLTLSILLCGMVAPATAQVIVYDDFSETLIDPVRWSPIISGSGNLYDMARLISGGQLFEILAVHGGTRDDVGTAFGRHELRFNETAALDGVRGRAAHAFQ